MSLSNFFSIPPIENSPLAILTAAILSNSCCIKLAQRLANTNRFFMFISAALDGSKPTLKIVRPTGTIEYYKTEFCI